MQKVTIKKLAEYCRDYIDLVSPSVLSRGGKRVRLPEDVFSAAPLMNNFDETNCDDQIILPINLTTKIADLTIESEKEDNGNNRTVERDIAIARDLDDVHRKFETNSYTKQLSLQFGHISFKGIPMFVEEDEQIEETGHKQACLLYTSDAADE